MRYGDIDVPRSACRIFAPRLLPGFRTESTNNAPQTLSEFLQEAPILWHLWLWNSATVSGWGDMAASRGRMPIAPASKFETRSRLIAAGHQAKFLRSGDC